MKKLILAVLLFFSTMNLSAQQWISEEYHYDSIMNLEYGTAENFLGTPVTLHMDLYLPLCESTVGDPKTPLVVFIHGGSFLSGDKGESSITDLAKSFAKRGYASASINYRLGFINDDGLNQCNFPNYPCFVAADTAEWYRAYYRAIQDAKGAVRFLVNHHEEYRIDPLNIFIAGESAGSFIAMSTALLDVGSEKFSQCYALSGVTLPNSNTASCPHNLNQTFPGGIIPRPDLGSIEGTIEPTTIPFHIKGVGNFFGGMFSNLLETSDAGQPKPAIYQYHQPCDLIVPFETGKVYSGMNWCFTNGYGCSAIGNVPLIYGSKQISNWNSINSHGYSIQDNFTAIPFPYEYIGFQPKNCFDQVINGNGCHQYDNYSNRKNQLISFFAPLVTTSPVCEPVLSNLDLLSEQSGQFEIYPNPFSNEVTISSSILTDFQLTDVFGRTIRYGQLSKGYNQLNICSSQLNEQQLDDGVYFLIILYKDTPIVKRLIRKQD